MYLLSFSCFWTLSLPNTLAPPVALSIPLSATACVCGGCLFLLARAARVVWPKKNTPGAGVEPAGQRGIRGGGRFAFSACSVAFGARGLYRPTPPARKKTQSQGMTKSAGLAAPSPSRDERNAAGVCSPPPPKPDASARDDDAAQSCKEPQRKRSCFPPPPFFLCVFNSSLCAQPTCIMHRHV